MEQVWHRRIVPPGYFSVKLTLIGTSGLLMNSAEADPDSALFRAFSLLGEKRKKSLDDKAKLREMEWKLRIYLDEEIGPYIPGKNVKEMLRSSATKWRKGEEIKRSLVVIDDRIPLQYEGPRDQEGLWKAGFKYVTMVSNCGPNAGRVQRCRPMFNNWKLEANLAFDPEDLDMDFLHLVVERAQKYGLGDYRPTFGSFNPTLELMESVKPESGGDALKVRDLHASEGHKAFVERIKKTA